MHEHIFRFVLSLGLVGCAASPPATPPASNPSTAPPQTEPQPSPAGSQTAVAEPAPAPAVRSVVDPDINASYATNTDPAQWERRFEREGREVFDRRDDILRWLDVKPGHDVADIGAGTGLFTLAFARKVGPEGRVYAVDVQPYFLEHIERKAAAAGLDNVELVAAEQHAPNLPKASIDLAFMSDVYHHIEQPKAYLAALREALVPGGRLVVIDFRRDEHSPAWIREHVRAAPEVFRQEIEAAGFTLVESPDLLRENFVFVFEPSP